MRARTCVLMLVGLTGALLLTACGDDDEMGDELADVHDAIDDLAAEVEELRTEIDEARGEGAVDEGEGSDSEADRGAEGAGGDDGDAVFDRDTAEGVAFNPPIEARHPGGVVVEVHGVRSTESSVELDTRIINGQGRSARLSTPGIPSRMTDDVGNEYLLVPPEDDDWLEVEEGEVLEGALSFSGRLAADATSLTVEFRPDNADRTQDGADSGPHLLLEDIPLDPEDADEAEAGDDADGLEGDDF
ncbi:hypothetical protein ER308_14535 [Egibacter rhizosphaerae]|uniref:DUF4352 domain-containing protein n=1 Tax=Egibacter rhizosphaerae TaxID=1670831 RepID=A0A411YHB2_9ACTN|nr:hypothetical protein [Egibacter rhizosphaerae]QBI20654.1 hypothetical protein ER308_14535 [Egibacter rhizosphaerae]